MLLTLLQTSLAEDTALEGFAQQEMALSLFDLFLKGGSLMWVLLALSIIAIYIFGKKCWMLYNAGKIDKYFMNDICDLLHDNKVRSALELCAMNDSPLSRMVEKGISKMDKSTGEVKEAMENVGNMEVAVLEKGLPVLASISGGAPMIGFLGTVIGMVQAFFNMSQAGSNIDITLLSGGIYVAMVTTVGGLIVGIIAYFGYNFLTSWISDLTVKMDNTTIDFIEILQEGPSKAEETEETGE